MLSEIAVAFRPFVKEVIKAGIIAYESSAQWLAEASEYWHDLMAEARSELSKDSGQKNSTSGSSASAKGDHPNS